jgi:hypothetical protein
MKKVQGLTNMLFAAVSIGLIIVGIAQAQLDIPTFTGKFTLINQVQWDKTVLQPGDYTITIATSSTPISALVRDSKGRPIGRFVTGIDSGNTSTRNALLISEKGGQLRVYSLALASLGKVLVYDRSLAEEAVTQARAPQTVPLMLAKR